jgi:hypothetical protein
MAKVFLWFLLFLITSRVNAQNYVGIKVGQNATSFPVLGLGTAFRAPIHTGIGVLYSSRLNKGTKHQFSNEMSIGVVYHRLFQTAIQLYDMAIYRNCISPRWSVNAGIGGGYQHSFYHYTVFRPGNNGEYEQVSSWKGRPQYCILLNLGAGMNFPRKDPERFRITAEVRTFVHGTFAKSYVPVVPYNGFQLGLMVNTKNFSAKTKKAS